MTHLQHFEDVMLMDTQHNFETLLDDIRTGNYTISLKYDGAPAIVVGHDESGVFISTKSYFNKTPKKFYSHQDIVNGVASAALQQKLTATFNAILECPPQKGLVVMGDLLFWEAPGDYFQPNVVRYYHRGVGDHTIGVAFHTTLVGEGDYTPTNIWIPDVQIPTAGRDLPSHLLLSNVYKPQHIDRIKQVAGDDYLVRLVNQHIREGLIASPGWTDSMVFLHEQSKKVKGTLEQQTQWFRTRDAALHTEIGPKSWDTIVDNYNKLRHWKQQLFTELNVWAQQMMIATVNKNLIHEGFVLTTPTTSVKIVDRSVFSWANFNANTQRGWDKSK